jgi:hypothetical protein
MKNIPKFKKFRRYKSYTSSMSLRIINDKYFMLIIAARAIFWQKEATGAFFRLEREEVCGFFPAHAVVCGFGHTY